MSSVSSQVTIIKCPQPNASPTSSPLAPTTPARDQLQMPPYIPCSCGDPHCDGRGPYCYRPYHHLQPVPGAELVAIPTPFYVPVRDPVRATPLAGSANDGPSAGYPPRRDVPRYVRSGATTPDEEEMAIQQALLESTGYVQHLHSGSAYSSPGTPTNRRSPPLVGDDDDFEEQLQRALAESQREATRAGGRPPLGGRHHQQGRPSEDYDEQLRRALEESARDSAPPPQIHRSQPATVRAPAEQPGSRRVGGGPHKTCSICIEEFPASECARLLPCQHDEFCVDCVVGLCKSGSGLMCPLCRAPFSQYQAGREVVEANVWLA